MFAGYNKNNAQGTLVGNWVEEDALRRATGYGRRRVPEPAASPERRASRAEPTHDRVLGFHAAHARPGDPGPPARPFETTTQAAQRRDEDPRAGADAAAPRATQRERELLARAQELHERDLAARRAAEERERRAECATSTLHASYVAPPPEVLLETSRHVPRGRNGARVVDARVRDLTRAEVDSLDRMRLAVLEQQQQQQQPSSSGAAAITRYSYAIATGEGLDFPATAAAGPNPFARTSAFTNDIRDTTKRHAEATEPAAGGGTVDEPLGPSLHQRAALERLVRGLRSDAPRAAQWRHDLATAAAAAATAGDRNDGDGVGLLELSAFRRGCVAAGLVSDREAIQIFMHLDAEHIGVVPLEALDAALDRVP